MLFFVFMSIPSALFAAAPGGVSANLELWLKADAGIDEDDGEGIDAWNDQSGQDNHATQTAAGKRPTYEDDAVSSINHNPAVNFDDNNDYLSLGNISAIKGGSDYALYAVGIREDNSGNYAIGADGGTNNQDLHLGYLDSNTIRFGQWTNNLDFDVDAFGAAASTPYMLFGEFDGSGHRAWELHDADETEGTNTDSTGLSGSRNTYIGWHNSSRYYDGRITEVIIYSEDLATSSDEQRVESYLALKYGMTLDQSSATDYLDSSSSTIWDATENASYNNDIAGIGQDDGSELDQATSTAESADAIVTMGSASSQGDGDFLIWGNDDAATGSQASDIPSGVGLRLTREWRLDETGNIGTVSVVFNLDNTSLPRTGDAADYVLLKDADGTFSDATLLGTLGTGTHFGTTTTANSAVTFTDVDFSDGDYFTLAFVNGDDSSLGGIFEGVKLWLDADDIATLHVNDTCTGDAPAVGGSVECWEDKSGEGAHVTKIADDCDAHSSGNQTCGVPQYRTNQFNGRAALEFFQSEDDAMRYDLDANGAGWTGTNFTQFIAFEQQGTPSQYDSFFSNGYPAGSDHYQIDNDENSQFRLFTGGGGETQKSAVFEEFDNTLKLYTITADDTTYTTFSDGKEKNTLTDDRGRSFEHYRINQNRNGHHRNNSKISEIIIYDRLLSSCELWAVNQYLGSKYGTNFGGGSPGGVGCEGIQVWYNAGSGVSTASDKVTDWDDLGPDDKHATSTGSKRPDYIAKGLNDNPTIRFDGTNDRLRTSLDIGEDQYEDFSIYSVYRPAVDSAGSPWGNDNGGWDRFIVDNSTLNNAVSTGPGGTPANNLTGISGLFTALFPTLAYIFYDEDENDASYVRVNGTTTATFTAGNGPQSDNNFAIGFNGNDNYFDGDVAEIVVYDKLHSITNRRKVETYLATKYGITLDDNQDYIDSVNTTIFDSNGTHSGYTNDIAGIGRDDRQSLDQLTSSSSNSGAIIEVSSASSQDSGDFLFWGNDDGTTSEVGTNLPPGTGKRLGRIWRFDETGDIGTITLAFDLSGLTATGNSADDFTLITDTDTTFTTGAATTSATSYSTSTKIVTFVGADIADNDYVALGTMNGGALLVDIVDASGTPVANPSIDFGVIDFAFTDQTATGTLGASDERIQVNNGTGSSIWTLSIAASSTTAVWSGASSTYDFNDPTAQVGDSDSDDDDVGGQLTIDPSGATLSSDSNCSLTGISFGVESSFSEDVTDSITLASANTSAAAVCVWEITGIDLSQTIPPEQPADSYQIDLVLSIIAS